MSDMPSRCAECVVRDSALCASLDDSELHALADIGRRKIVPRGHVVIWEGDRSTICANLVSGVLKVANATPDGREQIVGLLFPGDFVGRPFRDDVMLTVTALSDADLCVYPREKFETALGNKANLERMLLQRTMDALDAACTRMLSLGRKSATQKVASFLVEMSDRLQVIPGGPPARSFELPLSRGQMADVLGLTIETVSRQLTKLKSEGAIGLPHGREVEILDRTRLIARAGDE